MTKLRTALVIAALVLDSGYLTAQTPTGRIVGRILDAATAQGIPEATIQVDGTTLVVQSGVDGRYTLPRVAAGEVTLKIRHIGFAMKTVTGVKLEAGQTVEQSVTLTASAVQLAAQMVTASAERGTVSEALDQQRAAENVVSSVTAEQIGRSPDGTAAQAVGRVSGVTVQDSKYVFVRGLGERYTSSSLNGARVPSPEPEKRVVPLDIFPAGLIQSISASKTFTPDQQGDFSGAQVDIKTKEFPATRTTSLVLGGGYIGGATGASLPMATGVGGESFGIVGRGRDMPAVLRNLGSMKGINLTQGDENLLVSSLRNSWTPSAGTGTPGLNGSASVGGNDPIFGHRVGYLFSGTISHNTDVKDNQVRALADRGNTPGSTVEIDRFAGRTSSEGVLWGGLTNLSTQVGADSRLYFNGLYNRSADNDARIETGSFAADALPVKITRMQYVQRGVHSAQLGGEHQLGAASRIDWAVTQSGVSRYEPDRSEFVQVLEHNTPGDSGVWRWLNTGSGGAVRTFSDLTEHSLEYSGKYAFTFGPADKQSTIKVGGLGRTTDRDAQSISYAIQGKLTNAQREAPAEQLFDGRYSEPADSVFIFSPLSQGGSYTARDRLGAGFAMAEIPLGSSIKMIGGARYERDMLDVNAVSTLGSPVTARKRWNDLLPALAFNLQVNSWQQLRLSASRTLARPEYRELTPIISRDVINGENLAGDEHLERTNTTNVDLRWEAYPASGEVLSLALFAKRFRNPIERVYGSGSGGTSFVFYTNARSADNFGVELEARKGLGAFGAALAPFTIFSNVTVMDSRIHLYDSTQSSATNLSRRMVGQAPYVINGGLTYAAPDDRSTATLLYNRVGERITAAGSIPLPDAVERPRNVLDFSLRWTLSHTTMMRMDMKNLLDSPYEVVQGTVTRERYRAGRTVNVGVQLRQ